MKDFSRWPLGDGGQPETRVARTDGADDLWWAGDALVCILPEGKARGAVAARVAALVDHDLDDLKPPHPDSTNPEDSRRIYVYPWAGRRRRLVVVAQPAAAPPAALRVAVHRAIADVLPYAQSAGVVLDAPWAEDSAAWSAVVEGALYGAFKWNKYKTSEPPGGLEQLTLAAPASVDRAIQAAEAVAKAACLARGLTLEPADRLYPESLAARAVELAAPLETVRCEAWSAERIAAERLQGLLTVGRGSSRPVSQIEWVYEPPGGAKETVALVGKGVTYDSGGLQDKGIVMNHMNRDMAGAAAVVGMMQAVDALRPAMRVVGLAGACENMSAGDAYKTDDILVHRDGKTSTIGHTDAEGRLVLYDQLVYAREAHAPALLIDMATLTGAVRLALGTDTFAVMSNEGGVSARRDLLDAARRAGEKAWPLPLSHDLPNSQYVVSDYEKNFCEVMEGKFADLDNDGDSAYGAGSSRGAAYLASAVGEHVPWLHLDVAYTAADGPMGSPLPTLCQLLMARA